MLLIEYFSVVKYLCYRYWHIIQLLAYLWFLNNCTFERPVDLLKSLLVGTLFEWSRIWGLCISISDFLQSINSSLWFVCNCFKYNLFTIVNMMYLFSIKLLLPREKIIIIINSSNFFNKSRDILNFTHN